jgi:hypothetical protein
MYRKGQPFEEEGVPFYIPVESSHWNTLAGSTGPLVDVAAGRGMAGVGRWRPVVMAGCGRYYRPRVDVARGAAVQPWPHRRGEAGTTGHPRPVPPARPGRYYRRWYRPSSRGYREPFHFAGTQGGTQGGATGRCLAVVPTIDRRYHRPDYSSSSFLFSFFIFFFISSSIL